MDDQPEGSWTPLVGDRVWFKNNDLAAKAHEYVSGIVVEDNGGMVFVEEWDGTTHNLSKKKVRKG